MAVELREEGRIAAHRALLDAYRQTRQGDGWHTAPDDGYLYDHLTYHLDQLADQEPTAEAELHALFDSHAWLHKRVQQSRYVYDGYLTDLSVAWQHSHTAAHQQFDAGQEPSILAECVRYALIRTSANSLAGNYVPELVARAVETKMWPIERAMSLTRLIPDPQRIAPLISALLGVKNLTSDERHFVEREGLTVVQAIGGERWHVEVLTALAPHLTGELLREGLAAVQAIDDEGSRAEALTALAPHLTGELLREGLAAGQAIGHEGSRAEALVAFVLRLTGEAREQTLREGLAAVQAIDDERSRAQALTALVPHLTGELLREGLVAAQGIGAAQSRIEVLVAFAPRLTGEAREQTLREGLAAVQAIDDERSRAQALDRARATPYGRATAKRAGRGAGDRCCAVADRSPGCFRAAVDGRGPRANFGRRAGRGAGDR